MEKSQLPLLRKKKAPTNHSTPKEKELPGKELRPSRERVELGTDSLTVDFKDLRDRSPKSQKHRETTLTRDSPSESRDLVTKDGSGKSKTSLDLEWSRYTVKSGCPSDNYQKFVPEKSATDNIRAVHKCATGLTYHKPQPPPHHHHQHHHQTLVVQQCAGAKFVSIDCYYPSAVQRDQKTCGGSPQGLSSAATVFTFDAKHLFDQDSSPIYHELDPIDGYRPSANNHTYQSITEIGEEVRTLRRAGVEDAGSTSAATVQSHSGRSPVRSSSGSVLLSVQNGRRPPRTPPSPLPKSAAAACRSPVGSPTGGVLPPQSPRCTGASIFSKLWPHKVTSSSAAAVSRKLDVAIGNAGVANSSATSPSSSRDLTLEAICVDVTKASTTKGGYSTVYAVAPPPVAANVFSEYYQNFRRPKDHRDQYGLPPSARINLGNAVSSPSNRSSTYSTTCCQLSAPKNKNLAVENRLPFGGPDRDLSPGKSRSIVVDRWDADTGARLANLQTFRGDSVGRTSKQYRPVAPSLSPLSSGVAAAANSGKTPPEQRGSKEDGGVDSAPKTRAKPARKCNGRPAKPSETGKKDAKQPVVNCRPTAPSGGGGRLVKTRLSKSEESVVAPSSASAACHLFRASPVDSPLSEDDVFLDGGAQLLNAPSTRSAFSSPSCGIRMAELRASGRRKSDGKTPSPEPPATTTNAVSAAPSSPFFLPFFHFPAPCHRRGVETVGKQDAAVQTSPTKSPAGLSVRLSGLSSPQHRYMHTIVEEDHGGGDGRPSAERPFGRESKTSKEEEEEKQQRSPVDNDNEILQVVPRASERCETGLLGGSVDNNNSPESRASVKITRTAVSSCPAGSDRTAEQTDSLSSQTTTTTMTSSISSSEQTTDDNDVCQSSNDGSSTARASVVPTHEAETTTADRGKLSSIPRRSKASRLRPPRPAPQRAPPQGRCCPPPTLAVPTRAAKVVGEIRTLAPPLKQFHELMSKLTIDAATKKDRLVDRVEPTGTGDEDRPPAGEVKRPPSTTNERPAPSPTGPSVPLKIGLNDDGDVVQPGEGSRSPERRKKPPPHLLKSPPPASGSRDGIEKVGGRVSDGSDVPADSNPTGCSKRKCDSFATRHSSSLSSSSSLTASSGSSNSSSACSSESEAVTALKTPPSRKYPVTCHARQGGNAKPKPDCSKASTAPANRGQGSLNLALPRMALPRISISRCRDKDNQLETSAASTVSTDNNREDDDDDEDDGDNERSMEFSSV